MTTFDECPHCKRLVRLRPDGRIGPRHNCKIDEPCSVEGCTGAAYQRGMCRPHLARSRYTNTCRCGCGTPVKNEFAQGHRLRDPSVVQPGKFVKNHRGPRLKVLVGETAYESMKAACEALGVSHNAVSQALKKGYRLKGMPVALVSRPPWAPR